ncbi:MAG: hypothetical protein H6Q90_6070 [Deltaproteobacteria bacterium]|nr:hypothetical protein [Deltaproteobacteria bacterium]
MTRILAISMAVLLSLLATSCKTIDCGDGTIERNGTCVPADETVSAAKCGPFTELVGDQCVPQFPPTVCDPGTTQPELDAAGVITCIGTGAGFACPQPAAGKQTICGQIYDLATNLPFSAPGATCVPCAATAVDGPCSLGIRAFDAITFASNPQAAPPLVTGQIVIDDCGRYAVPDIVVPTGPFIGLGIDDADPTKQGPAGSTNAIGVATLKLPDTATKDFEGFIATKATTDLWQTSGGPLISAGAYVTIFRALHTGLTNQAGVTVTRNGAAIPVDDFYFGAGQSGRTAIDPLATATGASGTALVTNASIAEGPAYSAQLGALPAECQWELHAGASIPFVLFVQVFRPTNANGQTCPL